VGNNATNALHKKPSFYQKWIPQKDLEGSQGGRALQAVEYR
jgi:hypothetical protein